jgi:hypothetical protein
MSEKIKFSLYYHGLRYQCDVCGHWTEKFQLGAYGHLGDRESAYVCKDCIKEPADLDRRLTDHIAGFKAYTAKYIAFLESLRGQLGNLPSHADWQKEMEEIEAEWAKKEQAEPFPPKSQSADSAADDFPL